MQVIALARSQEHVFSKQQCKTITLIAGEGVEGDCHCGVTVKHRSRVANDPTQPNLRQVHLIHAELFREMAALGHRLNPGDLGENITTRGVDLLSLPTGTLLYIGSTAIVRLTGLRNPCPQIDQFQSGLMSNLVFKSHDGSIIRKSGVMGVVYAGGTIAVGDAIRVVLPLEPHLALERV